MTRYFDGYCPESLLRGNKVEMRLNEDDFWESEATGLQMTVFPPYAVILRWRGEGRFRKSPAPASQSISGLILTKAGREKGKEIFPDEGGILHDAFDLEIYLGEVRKSKAEYEASLFNPNDPVFAAQEAYLQSIPRESWQQLASLFSQFSAQDDEGDIMGSEAFNRFHELLYNLKIVFAFNWNAWTDGWKALHNEAHDYSKCSPLEASMYLTAIFRADRFSDGTIEQYYRNGTLEKIMARLKP